MRDFPFLVPTNTSDTPYLLHIESTHKSQGNFFLGMISAVSLCAIPFREDDSIEIVARLYRGKEILKTYEASGGFQARCHLFYFVSRKWPLHEPVSVIADTFRDLFLQIEGDANELFGST